MGYNINVKRKNICKYKLEKNFTELDKTFVLKIYLVIEN